MYKLFSNATNLKSVFGSYNTLDALKVKYNIQQVVQRLQIPSRALLEHMEQEGIALKDIDQQVNSETDWSLMSETVLKSHLRAAFLDETKLYDALSALSLSQQVDIRDLLQVVMGYLPVPSDTLLRRMEAEGLTLAKLGVEKPRSKVDEIREKLGALTQQQPKPADASTSDNNDALAGLKQRIAQLKQQSAGAQQAKQELPATDEQENIPHNVVPLALVQEKLKA
ncbi:hypothetical protein [Rheinheimera sp.]|uniref:hypothetical protein n=1 Tax=Rheinheimera sp. TaxID=1869214 RepID=UPI0027B90632|nr:hypothetical protein [Rheinheimera sp.]